MIDKNKIEEWFKEAVRLDQKYPQALKDSILNPAGKLIHPRFNVFLDNLCGEFIAADKLCQSRGQILKVETIKGTVYDFAGIFMQSIEIENTRRVESALDKVARSAEAEKLRQVDDFVEGGTDNEYSQELGLISEETKVKEASAKGKAVRPG